MGNNATLKSTGAVLVLFASLVAGQAIVLKVDTERWPQLAQRFNVMSIPNFVVMRNGKMVFQQPGPADHKQMVAWLSRG